jgi:uncharacterized protein (DUF433 family)
MSATSDRITRTPGVCGGDACIRGRRIPVWVLASHRQLGVSDGELLRYYPSLTWADLEAAWEYVATHAQEIEQAIRDNETGEEGLVE